MKLDGIGVVDSRLISERGLVLCTVFADAAESCWVGGKLLVNLFSRKSGIV